jgi:hypothetical protein
VEGIQRKLASGFLLALWSVVAHAGGPLIVGGPNFGVEGKPVTWDPAKMPILYTLDTGPLSATGTTTVINNASGKARVQAMFQAWSSVPTAAISYSNVGPIQGITGGDVKTAAQFNTVDGQCQAGTQSPIIFDADGSLFNALVGDPLVIGFAGPCKIDSTTGFIVTAEGVLNGRFQDGIDNPRANNFELTKNQFDQAFIHEFGHFSGLDHSQINQDVLLGPPGSCNPAEVAGLPVMFPILQCQARLDVTPTPLPVLAPDDVAWISTLYPQTVNNPPGKIPYASAYQLVPGHVFFSDGTTPVQGVNVIVRDVNDPLGIAVSEVSGERFTGRPGQSVTSNYLPCSPVSQCPPNGFLDDDSAGDPEGSRDTALMGSFAIPVPAGSYTVEIESVNPGFTGGSGLRPFSTPIPAPGNANATSSFTVTVGTPVPDKDFTLFSTPDIFDGFESAQLWVPKPELIVVGWLRQERHG